MSQSNLTLPTRTEAEARAERAYETDKAAKPLYHDGQPRKSWDELDEIAKESWRRNPTPRWEPEKDREIRERLKDEIRNQGTC